MLRVAQQGRYIKVVTSEDIDDFARLTGDTQRLHLDETFAKNNRFGRRIAHGMLTGGFVSACLGTVLPGEGTVLMEQSFKFLKPVFVDDKVVAVVTVDKIEGRIVTLYTMCLVENKPVMTGTAKVCVIDLKEE
jgi:3-hydroxybutyryl-CoA dehydratase